MLYKVLIELKIVDAGHVNCSSRRIVTSLCLWGMRLRLRLRESNLPSFPQRHDRGTDNSFQYLPLSGIVCAMKDCRHRWKMVANKSMHRCKARGTFRDRIQLLRRSVGTSHPAFCLSARSSQGLPSPPGFLGCPASSWLQSESSFATIALSFFLASTQRSHFSLLSFSAASRPVCLGVW